MPAALRLGLFFAALFVGSGASLPFIPVWFKGQGLSPVQLGVLLSFPYFGRTLAGPALALWADSFRLRRTPMAWMALGATLSFAALWLVHGFWPWLIAWFLGSTLLGALSPLGDVIALRQSRDKGFAYGLPRGIGSMAYVCGNVGMGLVLARTGPNAVLIWTVTAAAVTSVAAMWLLPSVPVHDGGATVPGRELLAGLGDLLRQPAFVLAIVVVGLIQSSHGFYYSFSTLAWRQQGLGAWTGPLWGFAVGVEVLFMWFLEPWRRRMGPEKLLIIGGAGATIRWLALSFSPPLWLLFPIQALHSLSFTATFMGSLRLMERLSPPKSASAAQTLNSAFSGGVLIGLTTVASGPLFAWFGPRGYLAMALISTLGVAGAVWLARVMRGLSPTGPGRAA